MRAAPIRFTREQLRYVQARTPEAIAKLVPSSDLDAKEYAKRKAVLEAVETMCGLASPSNRPNPSLLLRTHQAALSAQAHDRSIERSLLKKFFPEAYKKIAYLKARAPGSEPNWGRDIDPSFNWLAHQFKGLDLQDGLRYGPTQFKHMLKQMPAESGFRRLNPRSDSPKAASFYGFKVAYWLLDRRLENMDRPRARKNARAVLQVCETVLSDADLADGQTRWLYASLGPVLQKHLKR